jgi:putative ABC transport system permease protein
MALAIGANTAIFSIVNLVLFPPLPYQDSDRLIEINYENNKVVTLNDYEEFWRHLDFLEEVAGYKVKVWNLSGHGEPVRIPGYSVSASFLPTLRVRPAIGRNFTVEEDHSASPFVVLISDEMWRAIFQADPQILGKVIQMDGQPCEIIGVMPSNFKFPNAIVKQPQFWTTLGYDNVHRTRLSLNRVYTIGRLKPDTTMVEAQDKLNGIAKSFKGKYEFKIRRLNEFSTRYSQYSISILILVSCGVLLVLLIACSNIASLLLSRAITRKKEIALRIALGASSGKLMNQLLTESLLLCFLGGIAGILLSYWFRNSIKILLASVYPVAGNYFTAAFPDTMNLRVLIFTAFVAILTGLITGFTPAFHASKTDLNSALKEGSQASSQDFRSRNFHNFFVVLQIALALLLLSGAGLMIRSLLYLQNVELGYDPNFTRMDIPLPNYKYPEASDWRNFSIPLLERIRVLPGVQYAAIESGGDSVSIRTEQKNSPERDIKSVSVTADYFRALGSVLISGRSFLESESETSPPVIVINETFARKFLSGKNPIGQRVHLSFDPPVLAEIVGMVRDMRQEIDADIEPTVYVPFRQQPGQWLSVIVRGAFQAGSIASLLSKQVWAIDRNQVVFGVYPMSDLFKMATSQRRSIMFLLSFFAIIAITLAIVGIYSVISYSTNRQTHEIGIRMSLGAEKRDVLWMVLKKAAVLISAGAVIGLILSFLLNKTIENFIYGISRNDPITYILVSTFVIVVAFIASVIPAMRAAKVDPVIALREE